MKPETVLYLEKARQCLADAERLQAIVPRVAGREAYLAAFHAAEAFIYERSGRSAKTPSGLRARFALFAKEEPRIESELSEFVGRAYELKSLADYGMAREATISSDIALAAFATAARFVDRITALLEEAK
ncbi:MAG TPA: HEPN domain-containing protein [Rhizomicrobium sp.]